MGLFSNFFVDIGIDLGTCNTLIYVANRGIVCAEPSVVAVERGTNNVVAVGEGAKRILGKTPRTIQAIRPLRDGVIAKLDLTEVMIKYFLDRTISSRLLVKPRVVIGVPYCITEVERKAVEDSATRAGVSKVECVYESLCAAIGADIPINEPAGHMVCDIGGGTTEISVVSLGDLVVSNAIRIGGDEFDEAIVKHIRSVHNLTIGEQTAEKLKMNIGNAFPESTIEKMEIKGTDAITGLPRRLEVDSVEIRESIKDPVNIIVEWIKRTFSDTPPELGADIIDRGIVLTGGGAMLKGLSRLIAKETGVPVLLTNEPLLCVAIGAGRFHEINQKKGY